MLLMAFCCWWLEQLESWQVELVPDTTARAHLVSLGGVHALNIPIHRKHFSGGDVEGPVECIV